MRHVTDGELHAFLDGSLDLLPDGRGAGVRDHISGCSACQERLQDEEVVRAQAQNLLKSSSVPEVSLPSFEELRERAAEPPLHLQDPEAGETKTTRYRGPLRGVPLAWAATIVLALGVGWMGGQMGVLNQQRPSLVPPSSRYQEVDVSRLQRADLRTGEEESGESQALPPEINPSSPSDAEGGGQNEEVGQAQSVGVTVAGSDAVESLGSNAQAELQERVAVPSDPSGADDPLTSSGKVLSEPALEKTIPLVSGPPGRVLSAEVPARMEESVLEAEAQIPDSLENSLAVPGLKVVSIEWEERVAGEKALLIRQLLSRGDTLELRYLGMLLSAEADVSVPREARGSLDEVTGGRTYANVLEASLPVGWHQVVMEWGRGLLVARGPVTEQNLKALLKTLH